MNEFSLDSGPDDNMDLTPLIDAVFMLLIFFIMATTFSKPVLEVVLPKAESAAPKECAEEVCTVSINPEGKIFVGEDEVTAASIAERIKDYPQETPLVFNVDSAAPFEPFIAVLDAAKSLGRTNFIINTSGKKEEKGHDPVNP